MATGRCVGVFGGTFDPIHYGHLRTALEIQMRLDLAHVRFVPCNLPPTDKAPLLSARDRFNMVAAAIESEPTFVADHRELDRPGVSYSVETLASLRAELPTTPIAMIVGMDAFLSLPTWHRWQAILDLAHIVVAHRPGWQSPDEGVLAQLIAERRAPAIESLHSGRAGLIHVEAVTQLEISSSDLRRSISLGIDPKYLVPPAVRALILATECYAKEKQAIV
jgi:nicotinate-nucleotide adenylyltransferase